MKGREGVLVLEVKGYPFSALPERERDRVLSRWTALLNAVQGFARVSVYAVWDSVEVFRFRRILFFVEGFDYGLLDQLGYAPRPAAEPPRPEPLRCRNGLLELNGGYAKAYTVTRFPEVLPEAWPVELLGLVDELHLLLEAVEPAKARAMIDRRLLRVQSALRGSPTWQLEREAARLQEVQRLLGGRARLVKLAVVLIVRGDRADVAERSRRLEELLSARMVEAATGPCPYQKRLYALEPSVPVYHFVDTLSMQALYPFVQEQLTDWNGFYIGYNIETSEPVIFNPYERPNYNVVVLGESGSGKSMFLKLYARRWWAASLGTSVIIIDPEGEYIRVKDYIASGLPGYELSKDAGNLGLDPVKLYKKSGIIGLDEAVDVLAEFYKVPDEYRGELVEVVAEAKTVEDALRIAEERGTGLERYLKAVEADAWIYRGEPPLPGSRGAVYSLSGVRSRRAKALIGALLALVVSTRLRHSLVVVDEGWMFASFPSLMALFADIARRGRKRGVNFLFATQRPADVLRSEHGRTILEQSATVLLLHLNEASLEAVKDVYDLSEEEEELLLEAEPGQGILRVVGGWRLKVYIQPTEEELKLFSTRPGGTA